MSGEIFLKPLSSKVRHRRHAVYDVESKSGECGMCGHFHHGGPCTHRSVDNFCACTRWVRSQRKGFSRPILIGFYDGTTYREFANVPATDLARGAGRTDRTADEHVHREHDEGGALSVLHSGASLDEGDAYRPWQENHFVEGGCFRAFADEIFRPDSPSERGFYQSENFHLFGHNAGRFDHLFLIPWLRRNARTFTFEVACVQSKIQRLDVWYAGQDKKRGHWSFLDSISLLPMSLREVGEKLATTTRKREDFDLDTHEDDPRWRLYLKDDVLTLYEGLERYTELVVKTLGGEVGITSPSTGMKLYRRRYQGRDWIRRNEHFSTCDGDCHGCTRQHCDGECHGCAHAYVREGYYGGRTELFRARGRHIHYYDVNSSYPTSMREDMPIGRMVETGPLRWEEMTKLRRTHVGFVRARVYVPETCAFPPLPYRHPGLRKLVFPAGCFEGVWDFDELRLLSHPLVEGAIDKVFSSVWYEKKPVFRAMVDEIYPLRDKSLPGYNPALAEIAKILLNSFYGKWGMDPMRTGLVLVPPGETPPEEGWPAYGDFEHGEVWEVERECRAAYIVPQISAHIACLSRILLFHGLAEVQRLGGRLLYVDTDSIMCEWPDERTAALFPTGTKLGQWKQEDPGIFLDGEFILPKLYRLKAHHVSCMDPVCEGCLPHFHLPTCEDKKRCPGCATSKQRMKGVGSRGQSVANWDLLRDGGTVEFGRVSQLRTILARDMSVPTEVTATKSIRTTYDKRVLHPDGSTSPLVM